MVDASEKDTRYRPIYYSEEQPYWEAVRRHELRLQVCNTCEKVWYPVGPVCPRCLSRNFAWHRMDGRGVVSTYVVFHKAWAPWLKDRVPYVVAQVQLDEGPRLTTNLFGIEPSKVEIGLEVEAVYEDIGEGEVLLQFAPVTPQT